MQVNTLILGAGAAGLYCAAHAGPDTLVVDHAKAPGEKIRISGGGRCNFTNMHTGPEAFLSGNPHFCKSALARHTQWDFIDLVDRHGIPWHEKTLGQLFCDTSAKDIIAMLLAELRAAGADLWLQTEVSEITHDGARFHATLAREGRCQKVTARHLVVAMGGKSIPKMGATGRAYDIAAQFDVPVTETRAGLVPFTFSDNPFAGLSGVSTPVRVMAEDGTGFDEALLFTHRGLSGPAMLQVSNYWQPGEGLTVDLAPRADLFETLRMARATAGRKRLSSLLPLPARLVEHLGARHDLSGNMADWSDTRLQGLCDALTGWQVRPTGTEGYRTAEVTLGGIDTDALSSKTMQAKAVPGLHFIGEAVDVTGWLGGYNFQWAWSSAHAAGQAIAMARHA
ncbi:MAG: NAD(P)/FAD-dependent oxidoreductase [Salibaculum sp.]|uniref:NAD(P)/FAD-dependent oxidoreductase n=1 Tax=Salibaculum sp. TaxID=2855480 RepID=UPI00286FFAF4|nr:NAD(P)/FAD-dependent oxidoreductase [Salibaculum sp.]MDR9428535.1 NAD(P)/FAD-dependent oxidoreductase [Salibaculum sp.]MDR9481892.1 NAD(P)/FAD-dependent oxidoreductase [Salibaculum sp.]